MGDRKAPADRVRLTPKEIEEIDVLFQSFGAKANRQRALLAPASEEQVKHREHLDKAKELISRGGGANVETSRGKSSMVRELERLKSVRKGEPTHFDQSNSEITCVWQVSPQLSSTDMCVNATETHLTVKVAEITLFDS